MLRIIFLALICFFFHTGMVSAQDGPNDLTQVSLEDLMDIQVYSASKKEEPFFNTAAAVYVITQEDIRRSGATTIPELLRMVPGVSVQKINSHSWDVSARGFNGSIFANKLLVLIDGRAVYTPLFGGVFWELQDAVLEDIDRIEVVRGPGGTVWGANAVNGVVNIITKKAKDTQGGYIQVGGGSEERDFTSLRYGSRSGDWYYRTYAKYSDRDEGYRTIETANDAWQMAQTGFKAEKEHLTLQGDYYQGYLGQRVTLSSFNSPFRTSYDKDSYAQGGNLLTRYEEEDWSLQAYWSITDQDFQILKEQRNILDVEFNRHFSLSTNQELIWGLGYRINLENMDNTETATINAPPELDQLFSLFIQDEISLSEKLKLIVGSKVEHNIYTHFEFEPNVRLSYEVNEKNMLWAAASRPIRTPSRLETGLESLGTSSAPTSFTRVSGSEDLQSEKMRSFEVGYRTQPRENVFFDIAGFADHYDHITTFIFGNSFLENGFTVLPASYVNDVNGEVYGIELATDIKITNWWKIKGSYTYNKMNMGNEGTSEAGLEGFLENSVPRHNMYIRSSFDLPRGFSLDTTLRYMDSFANGSIPSNTQLDINLSKKIMEWQISVVGQNLLREHHRESYAGLSTATTQIERGGYIKAERRF